MQTMSEQTYNGWANYPTWAVHLWLTNDEGLYNHVLETAYDCSGETRRVDLADWIKDFVRGSIELDEASMRADLLGYALDSVDWLEIADSFLEDATND